MNTQLATMYMLVNVNTNAVAYAAPGDTPARVWTEVITSELFGPYVTRFDLMDKGWRAKRVTIWLHEGSRT